MPAAVGVQAKVNGAAVTVPSAVPLARNWTLAIEPAVVVVAVIVVAELIWTGVGEVMLIAGAERLVTVTEGLPAPVVVVWLPPLSVATAVSV